MPLYVTPAGQWSTSRAQAGPDATEIDLPFPATKADVVALLNRMTVRPSHTPVRAACDEEAPRWRVHCRGQFVASTRAYDEAEACQNIAGELYAREAPC